MFEDVRGFGNTSLYTDSDTVIRIFPETFREKVTPCGHIWQFYKGADGEKDRLLGLLVAIRMPSNRVVLKLTGIGKNVPTWTVIDDSEETILEYVSLQGEELVMGLTFIDSSKIPVYDICGFKVGEDELFIENINICREFTEMTSDKMADAIRAFIQMDFDRTNRDEVVRHAAFIFGHYYAIQNDSLTISTKRAFSKRYLDGQWNSVPGVYEIISDLETDSSYCYAGYVRLNSLRTVAFAQAKKGKDCDISSIERITIN